jgi:phosphoserine phosphatase
MPLHAHVTREIDAAPAGPEVGAFFDVDGTLIAGFSAVAFLRDRLFGGQMRAREVAGALLSTLQFQLGRLGFSGLIAATATWLRDVPERELEEVAERIFTKAIAAAIYPESRALVQAHRRRGTRSRSLLGDALPDRPLARELGIPHVLCTRRKSRTAVHRRHVWPTCYGGRRWPLASWRRDRASISRAAISTRTATRTCRLETVGRPRPTNPDRRLTRIAVRRRWPVQRFTSRGRPSLEQVARTALSYASLLPSVAAGLGVCRAPELEPARHGERRDRDLGATSRPARGVDSSRGEEHPGRTVPPSRLQPPERIDVLLLCKLLRRLRRDREAGSAHLISAPRSRSRARCSSIGSTARRRSTRPPGGADAARRRRS